MAAISHDRDAEVGVQEWEPFPFLLYLERIGQLHFFRGRRTARASGMGGEEGGQPARHENTKTRLAWAITVKYHPSKGGLQDADPGVWARPALHVRMCGIGDCLSVCACRHYWTLWPPAPTAEDAPASRNWAHRENCFLTNAPMAAEITAAPLGRSSCRIRTA